LIVATPPVRVVAAEVYPPPLSVTEPVGVGVPDTVTVTKRAWRVVMLDGDGVTVTVGVVLVAVVTATVLDPEALL
jgi:hypothetical protein